MDLEELAFLSEIVLNKYLMDCIHCIGKDICESIEKDMNTVMKLIDEYINDDSDFELILGET